MLVIWGESCVNVDSTVQEKAIAHPTDSKLLETARYNIRRLLRMIIEKGLGLLLCLLQASGLAGLFEKLAEIFGRNRMQNSDQRWVLT
jgi:hypothetical protein